MTWVLHRLSGIPRTASPAMVLQWSEAPGPLPTGLGRNFLKFACVNSQFGVFICVFMCFICVLMCSYALCCVLYAFRYIWFDVIMPIGPPQSHIAFSTSIDLFWIYDPIHLSSRPCPFSKPSHCPFSKWRHSPCSKSRHWPFCFFKNQDVALFQKSIPCPISKIKTCSCSTIQTLSRFKKMG